MKILRMYQIPFDYERNCFVLSNNNCKVLGASGKICIEKDGWYIFEGQNLRLLTEKSDIRISGRGILEILLKDSYPVKLSAEFYEKGILYLNDSRFVGVDGVKILDNRIHVKSSEDIFEGRGNLEKILFGSIGLRMFPGTWLHEIILKGSNLNFSLKINRYEKTILNIEGERIKGKVDGTPVFVNPRGNEILIYVDQGLFPVLRGVYPGGVIIPNAKEILTICEVCFDGKEIEGEILSENRLVKTLLDISRNPERFGIHVYGWKKKYLKKLSLNCARWISKYISEEG